MRSREAERRKSSDDNNQMQPIAITSHRGERADLGGSMVFCKPLNPLLQIRQIPLSGCSVDLHARFWRDWLQTDYVSHPLGFLLVVLHARCTEGWCESGGGGDMAAKRDMWEGVGLLN